MNHHEETTSLCVGCGSYHGNRRSDRISADIPQAPTPQNSSECTIMPCADVIVYKYRFESGKYQYRRWNETRGYWVDPYWIDVPH